MMITSSLGSTPFSTSILQMEGCCLSNASSMGDIPFYSTNDIHIYIYIYVNVILPFLIHSKQCPIQLKYL
jgi:hypothetical protein